MDLSPKSIYHTLRQIQSLVQTERDAWEFTDLSLPERADYWRRGFLSRAAVLYDFEAHDYREYLTDYERFVESRGINGRFGIALDNKLLFHHVMSDFEERLPELHGIIENGTVRPVGSADDRGSARPAIEWVEDRMVPGDTRVLKWVLGGGGHNVRFLTRTGEGWRIDGEPIERARLESELAGLNDYIVTDFAEQAGYADEFYPETTNTLRLVTMWDPETDEPFLARAIHRIGTARSAPVDNWSGGGLGAEIDPETGELGEAVFFPFDGELGWREIHPDTGTRIEGTEVPGWERIRKDLLSMAETVPYIPYVGWDLVVTDDGEFEIIEANNYPGVKSLQVHRPLLTDERIRRFYRTHGVR